MHPGLTLLAVFLVGSAPGRLCVLRTVERPGLTEAGAFQTAKDATPATVQVQVDVREKQRVSTTQSAEFAALSPGKHVVAVYSDDGRKRLQSFSLTVGETASTLCMSRHPTYGSWSVNPCECKAP